MDAICLPVTFAKDVCAILKLNPSEIKQIDIGICTDNFIMVNIEKYLMHEEGKQIIKLFQKYELKPIHNVLDVEEYYKEEQV